MALHDELLAQAWHLCKRDGSQASLRRAISTAYYAVFHLLIAESVNLLAARQSLALQGRIRRAYAHADMAKVCRQVTSSNLSEALQGIISQPIEADLVRVARIFGELQEARFAADYDLSADIDAAIADLACLRAEAAFEFWPKVRKTPNATTFLTALLLGRHWNR